MSLFLLPHNLTLGAVWAASNDWRICMRMHIRQSEQRRCMQRLCLLLVMTMFACCTLPALHGHAALACMADAVGHAGQCTAAAALLQYNVCLTQASAPCRQTAQVCSATSWFSTPEHQIALNLVCNCVSLMGQEQLCC